MAALYETPRDAIVDLVGVRWHRCRRRLLVGPEVDALTEAEIRLDRAVPTWNSPGTSTRPDANVLIATLGALDRRLKAFTGIPIIRNPSLPSENLARSWTRADFVEFRKQLREAFRLAIYIRKTGDPAAWRALFGSTFRSNR